MGKQMTHTPGPWTITDQEWNRENGSALNGNTPVVRMSGPCDAVIVSLGADKSEQMANARLIAAAPELLEACKTMVEWFRREREGFDGHRKTDADEAAWRKWFDANVDLCDLAETQATAAIASAIGE